MRQEINAIIGQHVTHRDLELLFVPQAGDEFFFPDDAMTWPRLLKFFGVFKSTSDARKAGWETEIQEGFTEKLRVGKFRRNFWILKNTKGW